MATLGISVSRRKVLLMVVIVTTALIVLSHNGNNPSGLNSEMKPYGFVVTLEYTGQLVAGVRAVLSQQCWIASFGLPLVIVEPFSNNSHLEHSRDIWHAFANNSSFVRFSNHYDLDHFNQKSRKFANPVMVTWEEFLNTAPRKIIFVTIEDIHHAGCLSFNKQMCGLKAEKEMDEESFDGCNISPDSVKALKYLKKYDFHIVREVCLNCMLPMSYITPDLVTEHIFGPYNPQNITLIINKWRFSMKISKDCEEVDSCKNEKVTLPALFLQSKRLERDANWYLASYFPSKMIVAIMIRVEWYFIMHRKDETSNIMECMGQLLKVMKELEENRHPEPIMPFVSMDVGSYGSGTFTHTIRHTNTSVSMYTKIINRTKHLVEQMYSHFWTFEDWEESFLTIPELLMDKGYIATLQSTIASKADCLILMGGGHFQHMALQNYLKFHPIPLEQCIKKNHKGEYRDCIKGKQEKDGIDCYAVTKRYRSVDTRITHVVIN